MPAKKRNEPADEVVVEEPAPEPEPEPEPEATPAAEAKAEELAVDLNEVEGSGKGGKITVPDVEAAAAEEEPAAEESAEEGAGGQPNPLEEEQEDPGEDQAVPGVIRAQDVEPEVDPWAVPSKKKDLTFLEIDGETPPEARRAIVDILSAFDDALDVNPMPLEWLVASLQAGMPLNPEDYRQPQ